MDSGSQEQRAEQEGWCQAQGTAGGEGSHWTAP